MGPAFWKIGIELGHDFYDFPYFGIDLGREFRFLDAIHPSTGSELFLNERNIHDLPFSHLSKGNFSILGIEMGIKWV